MRSIFTAAILCFGLIAEAHAAEPGRAALRYELPASTPKEVKAIVDSAWPKAEAACPGFRKYAPDLEFVGVESNLSYAPAHAWRVELKFQVRTPPQIIPGNFRAFGHTCYFGVSPDGSKLIISKRPCASICADQQIEDSPFEKLL